MNFELKKLIRPNVLAMKAYTSAREEFKDVKAGFIFLDANENPFDNGLNRYPDPSQRNLKNILSAIKKIPANQIILGNGSDEILDLLYRVFCEPNKDNVIAIAPSYGMYAVLANLNAVAYRKSLVKEKDFQPDTENILSKVDDHTKIIFLCSPNNPTGTVFKREYILDILHRFKGLVVIDEAYIDFTSESSWIETIDNYPNLVVIQTLSKAVGLAGIRLGIGYASSKIIAVLNKIKPPYNISQLTQRKAAETLSNYDKVIREVDTILQQKKIVEITLKELPFVQTVYPGNANFILIKVDDASKRYGQLIKKGIVVRNRSQDDLCENCLRITVGTETENRKLMDALKEMQTDF